MIARRNYLYLLILCVGIASANDEAQIRSAIQTKSEAITAQKVYVDYQRLTISKGWALAYGQLLSEQQTPLDWSSVEDCDPNLDKGLWAVLQRSNDSWRFVEYDACSIEPPYWYIDLDQNNWPCGIFKGLKIERNLTLEEKCLSKPNHEPSSPLQLAPNASAVSP